MIFRRYSELGSVTLLEKALDREGIRSKQRESASGRLAGGRPFSRGILYLILQNHLYHGEVKHKGRFYPGQHEAIVDTDLWSVVQEKLAANRKARELAVGAKAPSLLSGLIFDGDGNRMTPTHANKSGRRYRYYISASLLDRGKAGAGTMRVPASEVESLVLDQVRHLLASPNAVGRGLAPLALDARELQGTLERAAELSCNWIGIPPEEMHALLRSVVTRVTLRADRIDITIGAGRLANALGASTASGRDASPTIDLSIAAELRRSGQGKRMVIGSPYQPVSDASLVDVLKEATAAQQKLLADTDETLNEITLRTTKSKGRLTALTRLSYLAPDIIAEIIAGRQPPELSVKRLLRTSQDLPIDWPSQRAFLGLA